LGRQRLPSQLRIASILSLILFWLLPAYDENAVSAIATLLGFGIGIALERSTLHFEAAGPFKQRLGRFGLGFLVLALLYLGLRMAFAVLEPEPLWRIIRYSILGLWVGYGAPWCFIQIRLVTAPSVARSAHDYS
jgi:hypothetical protein